jgi:hypothetical protein
VTPPDRFVEGLMAIIREQFPQLFYMGLFDYVITGVNGEAPGVTCDVRPNNPDIGLPECNAVAIVASVSNMSATPSSGMACVLAFLDGDPTKPRIVGFEASGANPVARLGDQVMSFLQPTLPVVGTVSGSPFVGTITVANPITGTITQGSGRAVTP